MKSSPDMPNNAIKGGRPSPATSLEASAVSSVPSALSNAGVKRREEIIRFERLAVRYQRGPEVLNDVNFTLKSGSFSFLTGPSGAGKTTLLDVINLNLRPSRGFIHLFGQDCALFDKAERAQYKRRIGLISQDVNLIDHLSVFENVALPLRVSGQHQSAYREDVVELLKWVGLGGRLQSRPATLSGGEKQRAAIARAVISKPDILIADEPTGNVDSVIAHRLMHLFGEMNRMGATIFIATHDGQLARHHAGDIYHIQDGTVKHLDNPAGTGAGGL